MRRYYSVNQLAALAGVSIRTLHLYDKMKLLPPNHRADSGYRYYGEQELLRLQQILFYKEMGITLKEIAMILDDDDFDIVEALENHKKALIVKKARMNTLIRTIDKTINSIKNKSMIRVEELYEGMPAEKAAAYRKEAIEAFGREVVEHSEQHLLKSGKEQLQVLIRRQKELAAALFELQTLDPASDPVQQLVAQHYSNTRMLWGTDGAADK